MDFKELLDTPLNNFIKHSAKGSTWEKEDHKYIAKIPIPRGGGRNQQYRYFYDMNELLAYMKTMPWSELLEFALSFDYPSNVFAENAKDMLKEIPESDRDDLMEIIVDRVLGNSEISESLSQLNKKSRAFAPDEDFLIINEYYNTDYYGYTNNCASCTAAYDMRRRGYDVVASGISNTDDPPTSYELLSWYNGAKLEDGSTNSTLRSVNSWLASNGWYDTVEENTKLRTAIVDTVTSELKNQGNGARGHLITTWFHGGGHSVVYEVEHDEVVIRDCQTFETVNLRDWVDYTSEFSYIRTDNVEVNDSILDRVENRTGVDRGATTSRTRTSKGTIDKPRYRNNR